MEAGVIDVEVGEEVVEALVVVAVLVGEIAMGIGMPLVEVDGGKEGVTHMVTGIMVANGVHVVEIDMEVEVVEIDMEAEVVDDSHGVKEGTAVVQAKGEDTAQGQSTGKEIMGGVTMETVRGIMVERVINGLQNQVHKRMDLVLLGGNVCVMRIASSTMHPVGQKPPYDHSASCLESGAVMRPQLTLQDSGKIVHRS